MTKHSAPKHSSLIMKEHELERKLSSHPSVYDDSSEFEVDEDDTSILDDSECDLSDEDDSSEEFVAIEPSNFAVGKGTQLADGSNHNSTDRTVRTTLRVPVAPKRPGEGIYLSNAVRQFLTRNHSDSELPAFGGHAGGSSPMYGLMFKSESAEKLTGNNQGHMVFVHQDMPQPNATVEESVRPKDRMRELLLANGCTIVEPSSYKTLKDSYFIQVTPEMIESYDLVIMTAVRNSDLETLRQLYAEGRNFQCCNRFHESILHTAARRGCTEIMDFLLHTAQLDLRVVCDSGRNPLHDACWTGQPNFTIIRWILEACPDFLLLADNRNFIPFDYIPKEAYQQWDTFLTENPELLKPRVLV